MPERVNCVELAHINIVARDFAPTIQHFQTVFGGQYVRDIPAPQWNAGLLWIGGVLFEIFVPVDFLTNARYGPHYVGLEYMVEDLDHTREQISERGIDLVRDIGIAIHTDPGPCVGVAFEFYDHSFFSEPFDWIEPLNPPEYWRHDHPIGYTGLRRYSVVVGDHEAALDFYRDMFAIEELYEERRPAVAARVSGIRLADTVVEVITPTGPGAIDSQLRRYGDGMRSVVFGVDDLGATRRHFAHHRIELVPGDHPEALAVEGADNRGVMMEFTE